MKRPIIGCAAFAVAACLAGAAWGDKVDADHRVEWLTTVTDGVYNDASSWTGGEVPKDGIDGKYGLIDFRTTDITVRAPEGGFTDNSGTIFYGGGTEKHTLTLDTRGTSWTKKGVKAVSGDWGMPFVTDLTSTKIIEFREVSTTENDKEIWSLSDGLFTWTSDSTDQVFDLLSGTFGFGTAVWMGTAWNRPMTFRVHPEATLRDLGKNGVSLYGNSKTELVFLGGNHTLNQLWVTGMWSGRGAPGAYLVLSNDTTVTLGDMVLVGSSDSGFSKGRIDLYGTSYFNLKSGYIRLGDCWNHTKAPDAYGSLSNNDGTFALHDSSRAYFSGGLTLGGTHSSTGTVLVADSATVDNGEQWGVLSVGSWTNSWGRMTVQDNGTYNYYQAVTMGENLALSAVIEVKDNGRFIAKGKAATITNKRETGGVSRILVSGNGYLSTVGIAGADSADASLLAISADGGTIAAVEGLTPSVPFLGGTAVTLGAGGLTLDDVGLDLSVNASFADAEDATAGTLTKTGDGALTVLRNSSHSNTYVAKGTLKFDSGVTQFGKNLSFAKGTVLAFTDASSCVTADSLTFDTRLNISLPATLTSGTAYSLLKLATPLTEEQAANIVVSSGASTQTYAFSVADDGTLKVTPSDYTPGDKTWTNGAKTGAWQNAGNWNPSSLPAIGDAAKIEADAAIALTGVGATKAIEVVADVTASVSGEGALQVASGAALAEGAKLDLGVTVLVTVPDPTVKPKKPGKSKK